MKHTSETFVGGFKTFEWLYPQIDYTRILKSLGLDDPEEAANHCTLKMLAFKWPAVKAVDRQDRERELPTNTIKIKELQLPLPLS